MPIPRSQRAAEPMSAVDHVVTDVDQWQRTHRAASVLVGVVKKFGDDDLNQFVVGLGWYGFVAIYPLLLVSVTVLGFIGAPSLGHHLVATLHAFPVVGPLFNPASGGRTLHGSTLGMVIGVLGMLYGAQGVTQTGQQAMVRAWNVPQIEIPGFLQRLVRSLSGLAIIGSAFVVNAILATLVTGGGHRLELRVLLLCGMEALNVGLYLAAYRALTPAVAPWRALLPGAAVAATGFTFLTTLGSGLVQHQLRKSSATYGQFGTVIGLVAFLFLLAKISLYAAELNPVLHHHLWPRGLQADNPTEADDHVLRAIAQQNQRRSDERIGVDFGDSAQDRTRTAVDVSTDARPAADAVASAGNH